MKNTTTIYCVVYTFDCIAIFHHQKAISRTFLDRSLDYCGIIFQMPQMFYFHIYFIV